MTKTNVQPTPSNSQHHDTPNNKTHIIKFRVTETEKMELQCTALLLQERSYQVIKFITTIIKFTFCRSQLTFCIALITHYITIGNLNQYKAILVHSNRL